MAGNKNDMGIKRRDFLKLSATGIGALGAGSVATPASAQMGGGSVTSPSSRNRSRGKAKYNGEYSGERLNRVAFPMVGVGLIMFEGRILAADTPDNLRKLLTSNGQIIAEIAAPLEELKAWLGQMADVE